MREHADYLGYFPRGRADAGQRRARTAKNDDQAIARARDFIGKYPQSAVLDEVRMKLGEIFFRHDDYLSAQEQFEKVASERPDGAHATAALFLAGQCSMKLLSPESLNHALDLFGKVAAKHGPMETHARLHQALVKTKLGAPEDAVKIYDSIITAQPPAELELRLAALTGKADNLVAMGKADVKNFASALTTYDQIIATEGASPTWKNQASYKKAKTLEQQAQPDAALDHFLRHPESQPRPARARRSGLRRRASTPPRSSNPASSGRAPSASTKKWQPSPARTRSRPGSACASCGWSIFCGTDNTLTRRWLPIPLQTGCRPSIRSSLAPSFISR